MDQDELIITVTKKESDEIVARIFRDENGQLKGIVDDDYEVSFG